ncbi:MAG: VCBS repeat-containing protein, partial [Alphaproteobacteria bacterium]|nr:VCBS repeat-containing protein [Alphaproteobacteria bacterium]
MRHASRLLATWLGAALLAVAPAFAAEAPPLPQFVDETASAGLDGTYAGGWQYMVGGGAAVFDCSGDGFPDLMLAGGEEKARLFVNRSAVGGPLAFERQASGLEIEAITGAYPIDIDSDGVMDVVLLRVGENLLMRGKGDCRFEEANAAWGFDGGDA